MGRACGTYGDGEVYRGFMVGRAGEGVHLGDTGVDVRIILKRMFRKGNVVTRTGFFWLRIVRLGGLFGMG
jgi:hypothetical protein